MKVKHPNPNIDVIREFAANLQKAVDATGLTPYALAKKIGMDKDAIKNLLKGDRDPKFSTIIHLAKKMRVSLDQLLGVKPVKPKREVEVEVKKENSNLISRISALHKQDVELLETIIGVLEARKARSMARFLNAVRDSKQPMNNTKENKMTGITEKVGKSQTSGSSVDDDLDDDDFDDDLNDDEGFDDDRDFDDNENPDSEVDDDFDDDDDFDEDDDFDDDDEDIPDDDDDFD
jgi:transcriptional regulator with XRE-family HTH domain